ncbi:MAG TPA: hypothetical protein VF608_06845 [Thermoanaerobaculia bacterium]
MSDETDIETREDAPKEEPAPPPVPRWRPAEEPTCCGSGCLDCPF